MFIHSYLGKEPTARATRLQLTQMIRFIISGGQTGADRGGLEAGKILNLKTGGFAPKGWRTENGSDPTLAEFGLVETESSDYPPRTAMNVKTSDGTVLFGNERSPGSRLTIALAEKQHKPLIHIKVYKPMIWTNRRLEIERFRKWVVDNNITILNVAGNRESKEPGIMLNVIGFLVEAIRGAKP